MTRVIGIHVRSLGGALSREGWRTVGAALRWQVDQFLQCWREPDAEPAAAWGRALLTVEDMDAICTADRVGEKAPPASLGRRSATRKKLWRRRSR